MDITPALRALPIFASIALTPVVMQLLARLSPPRELRPFEDYSDLKARNGWIDAVACVLSIGSFFLPFILFGDINAVGWPAIGVAFGSAVILPCCWIFIATIPLGAARYHEYWRFYEQRYGVGATALFAIYVPLAAVGVASAFELVRRGIW